MSTTISRCPGLVNEKEAARILNISPGTLSVWRCTNRYRLPFVKIGKAVRYRVADLERFIESRTIGGEPE